MSSIVGANGRPYMPGATGIKVHKWDPRKGRKCGGEGLCPGMEALLESCMTEKKGTIQPIGRPDSSGLVDRPTGIGFMCSGRQAGHLLLFNYCPVCGKPLPLELNKSGDFVRKDGV